MLVEAIALRSIWGSSSLGGALGSVWGVRLLSHSRVGNAGPSPRQTPQLLILPKSYILRPEGADQLILLGREASKASFSGDKISKAMMAGPGALSA
ncbi:hypothetical protein FB446DRAFT_449743 [Lentinula raphanica]|nr:hypothetical protein FB446DRAFT_449743 [Lentinula raphanica]